MELPINRLNVCFFPALHLYLTPNRKQSKMTDWQIILLCWRGGEEDNTKQNGLRQKKKGGVWRDTRQRWKAATQQSHSLLFPWPGLGWGSTMCGVNPPSCQERTCNSVKHTNTLSLAQTNTNHPAAKTHKKKNSHVQVLISTLKQSESPWNNESTAR